MASDHAVIVRFQYRFTDLAQLHALEEELIAALGSADAGEFDGNEVAPDSEAAALYMYGPDADRLFEAVKPVLESSAFMHGAVATKRYGPPEDGAQEVQVTIGPAIRKRSRQRKRGVPPTIEYGEGDLFAVPLEQGGFGLCLVARRRAEAEGCTLGYFFGPRIKQPPSLENLPALEPQNAYLVGWFGDLGIIDGTWTPVGRLPGWRGVTNGQYRCSGEQMLWKRKVGRCSTMMTVDC
jgi:hypothetical protein